MERKETTNKAQVQPLFTDEKINTVFLQPPNKCRFILAKVAIITCADSYVPNYCIQ